MGQKIPNDLDQLVNKAYQNLVFYCILQYDKQWNLIDEMMLEDTGNFHDMELR